VPSSNALRIVHVSQPTSAGVAVYVRDLARAGVEAGLQVSVVCPPGGDLGRWSVDAGATWLPFGLVRNPHPADIGRVVQLRRLFKVADVVHLHSSKAGALGRIALRTMRRPPASVFTPNAWSWAVGGRAAVGFKAFERKAIGWCDVVIAVSEEERRQAVEVLGVEAAKRTVVLENGVDVRHFCPKGSAADRSAGPLLICVGRLSIQKAQDTAIKVVASVPGAELWIIGDGPLRGDLEALAQRLKVADRVRFVGAVVDTAPFFRAADVVLVPSRWDGLSFALLEAMACGCAVVATEVARAAVAGAGRVVRINDPAAMQSEVMTLLVDHDARRRLGAAARVRAQAVFSIDRCTSRTLDLWRELAAERSPQTREQAPEA
jgi:glycosyltransferase involved in cell wall biosynthesis